MKKVLKIGVLVFLGLSLILAGTMGIKLWWGIREAKDLAAHEIRTPELASVSDGTWRGQVEWGILAVEVDVTMDAGEITAIELVKHENGRGSQAEKITEHILTAQSLDVDAVSGATLSSRAILNAVADALNNSQ